MVPLLQNTYDNLPQGQDDIQILIESGTIEPVGHKGLLTNPPTRPRYLQKKFRLKQEHSAHSERDP